jgi:hypothetical protein
LWSIHNQYLQTASIYKHRMKTTWQTEVYITLVESPDIYKHRMKTTWQTEVYITLVESPDIFQPMWYILLFVMWFSSYVFINVRTFNQCDIYFCLSCGFQKPHDKQVYITLVESPDIYKHIGWKPHDKRSIYHIGLKSWHCVYKCQDFQPMWYILLFVMWISSYVFINVRTFNQCDIYFCLSCGFHPICL